FALLAVAGIATATSAVGGKRAGAAPAPPVAWGVGGGGASSVHAIAVSGTTAYIGGTFTHVGPYTGSFVAIDPAAGPVAQAIPQVTGDVKAVASDGSGGWYLGGAFSAVGGEPRANLAHVAADGTLDAAWTPRIDGTVSALAVAGSTVYVGGTFSTVNGGTVRHDVAAFDSTGAATSFD